jgi:hypothetical protein
MTERLIDKLDRLGAEAGIAEMTPEIRRFALLVRGDMLLGWDSYVAAMVDAKTLASNPAGLTYNPRLDKHEHQQF